MGIKDKFKFKNKYNFRKFLPWIGAGVAVFGIVVAVIAMLPQGGEAGTRNQGLMMAALFFGVLPGIGLFLFTWNSQGGLVSPVKTKQVGPVKDMVLCLNFYPRQLGGIKVENMAPGDVALDADEWDCENNRLKYKLQYWNVDQAKLVAFRLSDKVTYTPDMVARMIGCEPLQKLKAIQSGWIERLAPFAPVAALGIGAILFVIVMGE